MSIVPWSETVVWAIWDLGKSNQECLVTAAPYLKHLALWVLEWSWNLAAMALLSCSNFWPKSLSVSSSEAEGASRERVSGCTAESRGHRMILSVKLAILAAYSGSEQSWLRIFNKWKAPRSQTRQWRWRMPRPFVSTFPKYVETGPGKPPFLGPVANKCLKILVQIASKNWAIANRFIVAVAKAKASAVLLLSELSYLTPARTKTKKLRKLDGFSVIHKTSIPSLIMVAFIWTACSAHLANKWGVWPATIWTRRSNFGIAGFVHFPVAWILFASSFNSSIVKASTSEWVCSQKRVFVSKKYPSQARRRFRASYIKNTKVRWRANLIFLVTTYKNLYWINLPSWMMGQCPFSSSFKRYFGLFFDIVSSKMTSNTWWE